MATVAQVVPDLATFAVDDGFAYAVADSTDVVVGSIVRVPLGGRRIRGWVTSLRAGSHEGLKQIVGVSGAHPTFTEELLQTLRWAAVHYVAPLAALLAKAGPPNLPKSGRTRLQPLPAQQPTAPAVLGPVLDALRSGRRPAAAFVAGSGPWESEVVALCDASARSGRGSLVVVPTAREAAALRDHLGGMFGNRVVATTSSAPAAARTKAWSQARGTPGTVVVGTPEVALWPLQDIGIGIVVEEGRRAMKARQSPTLHVRELLRRRASVERFGLTLFGQVPTLESVAAGSETLAGPGRAWPLVEIVDRTLEPPTASPIADATRTAIAGAAHRGQSVFVFVSRRGYAPASRCSQCGELRRCPQCGSSPGREQHCRRCGTTNGPCTNCGGGSFVPVGAGVGRIVDELRRTLGELVTATGEGGLVQVGTERDIPRAGSTPFAVVMDADTMLLRPHYRAEEDALRILARVASAVRRGRGHRCLIQTRLAGHRAITAMRHGHWDEVAQEWLDERESEHLPPYGELLALELADTPLSADEEIRAIAGNEAAVFGPGEVGDRQRWLLQAPDLRAAKVRMRSLVQSWRDRGSKVRVDSDPIDV